MMGANIAICSYIAIGEYDDYAMKLETILEVITLKYMPIFSMLLQIKSW